MSLPFQCVAVIDLLGFVHGASHRDLTAVLRNFFGPGRPSVCQDVIALRDPEFLFLLLHIFWFPY